ncbi:Rho GTPase activation protein [Phascolomyces articulosus]|uniref:Rho GTPase activation protein n=1 Tax=Phascolomyces articulosus TaxID=60185 RepID=A0AAD5PJ14_9FUNG|nr:Rho GTPase activation protein [Phascolomyces articulosus]
MASLSAKVLDSDLYTNDNGKKVVSFIISVRNVQDSSSNNPDSPIIKQEEELWQIQKLYSDFLALDAQLKAQGKFVLGKEIPKLPDKALFVTHVQNRQDQRKIGIQEYLKQVLELPLQDTTDICEFLSSNVVKDDSQIKVSKYRQGYLRKRGKNLGCWKKRYFILDGPNLKYYESEYGLKLGSIHLTEAQLGKQKPADLVKEEAPFQHALLIIEPKKTAPGGIARHILCANSDRERDEWMEAMEQHVNYDAATKRMDQIKRKKGRKASSTEASSSSSSPDNNNNKEKRENRRRSSLPTFFAGPNPAAILKRHSIGYGGKVQQRQQQRSSRTTGSSSNQNNITSDDNSSKANSSQRNNVPWFKKVFSSSNTTVPTKSSLQQSSSFTPSKHQEKTEVPNSNSDSGHGTSPTTTPVGPNQVFGIPLEDAVKVAKISETYQLPAIIYRCIDYLEAKDAILEEGIYRRSGNAAKIRVLKARFNEEGDIDLLAGDQHYDIHVVSSLLKQWFRELPGNILTDALLKEMLEVTDLADRRERITEMGRIISLLPLPNYTLLRMLCAHLIRVIQNAGTNKMTLRNMGIVFSATLGIPTSIFSTLLTEFDDIFWTNDSNFQ